MPKYKHHRPRGFAPWNPSAASRSIIDQVNTVIASEDGQPLTVRYIFYRLVVAHAYPKTEKAYANLCEKVNRARRSGMIPFRAIRDDGESRRGNGDYSSIERFGRIMAYQAQTFAFNPGIVQPCAIEVHVETAGMMPSIARAAASAPDSPSCSG